MAKVDEDLDLAVQGAAKSGGKMKIIIISVVIGLIVLGLSITITILLLKGDAPATAPATAPAPAAAKNAPVPAEGDHAKGGDDHDDSKQTSNTAYMNLSPAFVVNLDGKESDIRYLQISVSVQVGKDSDLEIVKKHMPVLRHNLNLLFSSLDFNEISSREGKEKLAQESLGVIQKALKKSTGKNVVQAVFFNSIVGQ